MDIVKKVFEVFGKIYKLAKQAKSNKANCRKAATRFRGLSSIIHNCLEQYERYGGINKKQREGFVMLLEHVSELQKLVSTYSQRNFIMRGLKANSFKARYEKLDTEICRDIQIIQTGVGVKTIQHKQRFIGKYQSDYGIERENGRSAWETGRDK